MRALKPSLQPSSWQLNSSDLYYGVIMVMAPMLVAFGIIAGAVTVNEHFAINEMFFIGMGAIFLGMLTLALSNTHLLLSRLLFIVGLTALFVMMMDVFSVTWLPFAGIILVIIDTALAKGGGILSAAAVGGASWWLDQIGLRAYPLAGVLFILAVAGVCTWVALRTYRSALITAWDMERQTDEMLLEARERQADLAGVLKSLESTTELLEQANRKLSVARRQAEDAQRLKEQFAANVSHELRTPLNLILGFSEMLYMSPDVYGHIEWPPTLRRDVYQIYRASRHLLELIDDILDLSRYELTGFTLNKEPTDVSELLHNAVDMTTGLFRERPVKLELEVEPNLPILDIDRTRIRQVVLNLLSNARRFTEQGHVLVHAKRVEGDVIISVTDSGPGIPAGKINRIFEEFYQIDASLRRAHDGAGLGLAISKNFVQAHEGRIWVESEEGKGSTFSFSLPIPEIGTPTLYPKEMPELAPKQLANRTRIAIVDPDSAVAALVKRHLPQWDVMQADTLEQLAQKSITNPIELVIENVTPITARCTSEKQECERDWHNSVLQDTNDINSLDELSALPVIRCSLPSKAWLARELSVSACLNKPVTADQLTREVSKFGAIRQILVVDDDRGFCQLVERILGATPAHYFIRHAYDGEEGFRVMQEVRPDLVILDLIMPKMDGFQLLVQKSHNPTLADIPVLILSVTSAAEDALTGRGSRLTVDRAGGMTVPQVLRCLSGLAEALITEK